VLTLAVLAASVFLLVMAAAPAPARIDASAWGELAARTVAGAYHVHTTRSDGIGDRNAVAAAAAHAGLAFVILTDHGDATRPPDPPVYLAGVLVLDGVEISTQAGHYVAIDMPAAPYPLGGAADAVVEDVRRLGGFGIAAHPDSPKPALRWTDDRAPIDGIEWLNADSEWRAGSRARVVRAGIGYLRRPGPAVASLFDRPVTLDRWDRLASARPVVALAGADAHGGVGRRAEDSSRSLTGVVGIPSYEASFAAFSNRMVLDHPLTGNAVEDAREVLGAIRKGSVFTAIDGWAGPALLDFYAEAGPGKGRMGSVMPGDSDGTIVARAPLPRGAELFLLRDGQEIARAGGEIRRAVTHARGAYRVEVRMPGAPGTPPVPWLVSNPIYFGDVPRAAGGPDGPVTAGPAKAATIAPFPWRIEKDASSSGVLRLGASEALLEYKLGAGPRASQFVAMATDVHGQAFKDIELSLAGDRPMRVSVQVRRASGERWGSSLYVDPAGSAVRVPLARLQPITASAGSAVSGTDVTSILLVIDLTNAAPGRSGVLRVIASALIN
jgi:hypothetical protein